MMFFQADQHDGEGHEPAEPESLIGRVAVSRPRAMLVHATLVLFAMAIVGRAVQVQVVDSKRWTALAERQQIEEETIAPPRGQILDANGSIMVESRELMRVGFTPRNIKPYRKRGAKRSEPLLNPRPAIRQSLRALGVKDALAKRVFDTTRAWVELPGLYLPSDVERLIPLPGVTIRRVLKRRVTAPEGIRGVLGTVNSAHVATGGIEQELDSLLTGVGGRNARVKDGRGNQLETPNFANVAAQPGHSVTLTINGSLQDLAERELADGITRTGSSGGDVVIVDPRDGAVLAMAGVRDRKPSITATSLAEPYEPGSVMKPFVIARALDLGRVHADELINTESGQWTVAKRTIHDEHKAAMMSVRDVIRLSSNIGAAKIGLRMSEQEEYEALRDFGFGVLTGLPYPAESRGSVPTPKWRAQTAASVAMGYEMMATAMQLASAYVSIANGGELLQPALIREIHDPAGRTVFTHQRRVLRRAMKPETAALMRTILSSVVDSGTAVAADMATYDVAGKSGTARIAQAGNYDADRRYNSTFVGMFPAQKPQYVIVVRLVNPKGKIFGGTVAGRVVNVILQGALATRESSLDRSALAEVARQIPAEPRKPLSPLAVASAARDTVRFDSLRAPLPAPAPALAAPSRVIVALPLKTRRGHVDGPSLAGTLGDSSTPTPSMIRAIPSVYGLNTRQAVRTLHAAGFQVSLKSGTIARTRPVAGALLRSGSVVVLEAPR